MATEQQTRSQGAGFGRAYDIGLGNQAFIGRRVVVGWGNARGNEQLETRAADIVRVNDADNTVQLMVINPDGSGTMPLKARFSETLALNCWSPIEAAITQHTT